MFKFIKKAEYEALVAKTAQLENLQHDHMLLEKKLVETNRRRNLLLHDVCYLEKCIGVLTRKHAVATNHVAKAKKENAILRKLNVNNRMYITYLDNQDNALRFRTYAMRPTFEAWIDSYVQAALEGERR